ALLPRAADEASVAIATANATSTAIRRRDNVGPPLSWNGAAGGRAPFSSGVRMAAAHLVEVDGEDDGRPDDDLLPEGLDALDHEAVLKHRRDERADRAPENRPDAAEKAGPADHDGAD